VLATYRSLRSVPETVVTFRRLHPLWLEVDVNGVLPYILLGLIADLARALRVLVQQKMDMASGCNVAPMGTDGGTAALGPLADDLDVYMMTVRPWGNGIRNTVVRARFDR
jgi:hypothetical protein